MQVIITTMVIITSLMDKAKGNHTRCP